MRCASIQHVLCALILCAPGCVSPGNARFAEAPASNPIFVPASNLEAVWERTVDVVHAYHFRIARENQLAGIIETEYRVGSGILEPWHHDSVGAANRLESTLQSIRRKVHISLTPDDQGAGYLVGVEVLKETEDLPGVAANSRGGATLQESTPLETDLTKVVGQSSPSIWVPIGRDSALEADMLRALTAAYSQ